MKRKKVLIIEPPFYRLFKPTYSLDRYPHSLAYLSRAIKDSTDWDVMAYNADFSPQSDTFKVAYLSGIGFKNYLNSLKDMKTPIWKEVESAILEYKPDVIGITSKSQNYASARIVAKISKEINNKTVVIAGGPHPTMVGEDTLKCPDIDICVRGEGEVTMVELLEAIESGKEFNGINGIIFRDGNKNVVTLPRAYINDLNTLGYTREIAHEVLKDYDKYPVTIFKHIFTTRGCPYNCHFCGSKNIWSRKVRFRSPENIVGEIKGLREMGLKSVHFDDDTFGVHEKFIRQLCEALQKDCPELKWSCEIPVQLVNDKIISLMKESGCFSIQIGMESGNNNILKQMGKVNTIEEALNACKVIKRHGIELQTYFMVGFPMETEETLNDTITAMTKVESNVLIYSIFTPYPGTDAFEYCREKGLIPENYDVSMYNHKSPTNCFCVNIEPERFRVLVSKVEKMVDRKNYINRMKRMLTLNTIWKIKEMGMGKSIQKGISVFVNR